MMEIGKTMNQQTAMNDHNDLLPLSLAMHERISAGFMLAVDYGATFEVLFMGSQGFGDGGAWRFLCPGLSGCQVGYQIYQEFLTYTQIIHVWYIYIYLPTKLGHVWGKCS